MEIKIENILDKYDSPSDIEYETTCLACNGTGIYLGTLGHLAWYRCRYCGIEYNVISRV